MMTPEQELEFARSLLVMENIMEKDNPAYIAAKAVLVYARRYRWLRECSIVRSDRHVHVAHNRYVDGKHVTTEYPSGEQLDNIVDVGLARERHH